MSRCHSIMNHSLRTGFLILLSLDLCNDGLISYEANKPACFAAR